MEVRKRRRGTRRVVFTVLTVLMFAAQPSIGLVAADGCVLAKTQTVFQVDEESQYAVIHHTDGVQNMFISVGFDWQDSDSMAWILPVPSTPQDIRVGILDGTPEFSGSNIQEDAKDAVIDAAGLFTMVYVISAGIPWPLTYVLLGMTTALLLGTTGFTVHDRLEMGGLVVEVVSATEGEGMYSYLTANGLEISEGLIPQLDAYVEKRPPSFTGK